MLNKNLFLYTTIIVTGSLASLSLGQQQQQCRLVSVCDEMQSGQKGERGDVGRPGKSGPSGPQGVKGEPGPLADTETLTNLVTGTFSARLRGR